MNQSALPQTPDAVCLQASQHIFFAPQTSLQMAGRMYAVVVLVALVVVLVCWNPVIGGAGAGGGPSA